MPGTRRSRVRFTGSVALLGLVAAAPDQPAPDQLGGDPARGEAVVARQSSTCVLCHAGPFADPHMQGDVGPDLHGVGSRLGVPELRAQLVDARRVDPETVMPSFYRTEGLERVGPAWRGKPILSAAEIEDVVAYLATLR